MVCIAVIGTYKTSAPAPAPVPRVPERYTVVRDDDCEAIFKALLLTIPVPRTIWAESDARYREPLLNTDNCPTPELASALIGEDAEGLEVVSVAEADESDAA
jgi:hypothetical protein